MLNSDFSYNILCVDDDKESLENVVSSLEIVLDDVDIFQAIDVKSTLEILKTTKIDLIISDIDMPQIDGYEFAKTLKDDLNTKNIPIIFVTAVFVGEQFEKKGFDLGAIDYINKPINLNRLKQRISLYKNISQKEKKLQDINANLDTIVENKIAKIDKLNETYNIAQDIASIGHCEMDTEGNYKFWSNEIYKILELPKDTSPSLEIFLSRISVDDKELVSSTHQKLLKSHKSYDIRCKIVTQNNTIKYIQKSCQPQFENEKFSYFLGTIQDITDMVILENSTIEKSQEITDLNNEILFITKSLEDEVIEQYIKEEKKEKKDEILLTPELQMQRDALKKLKQKLAFQQKALKMQKEQINRQRRNNGL